MIDNIEPQTDFITLKHAFETECDRLSRLFGSSEKARTHAILKLFDGLSVQEAKRALMEAYRAIEVETRLYAHDLASRFERTVFADETEIDPTPQDEPMQDTPQDDLSPN